MSRITGSQAKSLVEAYQSIYNIQEQVSEDDLALEIFEAVAYALISQGHTAVDVLEYFANVDEEVIIEDLIALSEGTFIIEEVVSEEYIEEQMQQLDEVWGLAARGAMALARPAANLAAKVAPKVASAAAKLGQKAANVAWKGGSKATPMGRFPKGTPTAPGTKIIGQKNLMQRAGSAVSGAVGKVKDVAKGALNKLPGGASGKLASGLKTAGKWALGGAAFEGGMRAVQGLTGGGAKTPSAKPTPSVDKAKFTASKALGGKTAFQAGGGAAAMKKNPKLSAADVQKSGNAALRASAGGDLGKGAKLFKAKQEIMAGKPAAPKPAAPAPKPAPAPAPAPSGGGGGGGSRTPTAKPDPTVKPPTQTKPTADTPKKPSISQDVEDIKQMQQRSRQRQGVEMGGPEGPGKIDKSSVESDIKAAQEREKKKAQAATKAESYDVFDLVLEYLLETDQAETMSEAQYIMTEMDTEVIHDIVEAKRKSYSAKAARAGKDIGLPGKGFEKIATEAGERYGSKERGEKVAGAVLAGLRAKHGK